MVLNNRTIGEQLELGRIKVEMCDRPCLHPAILDVHLDDKILAFRNSRQLFFDVRKSQEERRGMVQVEGGRPSTLHPGEFMLGSMLESACLPADILARLEGKSALGRLGLLVHSTAGYIDRGWRGHLTLELSNVANLPIPSARA